MLGKLFKYELKNTAKVMLTIYAVLAAVTTLGSIVLSTDIVQSSKNTAGNVLAISMVLLYVLSVFALFIVTYVYMCIQFYKTMYSDQGYLTHTLPVSPVATFHVKLITSLFWMLCSIILLILSVTALITGVSRGAIWSESSGLIQLLHQAEIEFQSELGISFLQYCIYMLFSMLLSCLSYLLLVFASASVGQLFSQNKTAASIIAGIAIYFVQQIASAIFMLFSSYRLINSPTGALIGNSDSTAGALILGSSFMTSGIVSSVIFVLILYVTCIVIVRKHINLD